MWRYTLLEALRNLLGETELRIKQIYWDANEALRMKRLVCSPSVSVWVRFNKFPY